MTAPLSEEKAELIHYPRVFTTCQHGLLFVDRVTGLTGEDVVTLMLSDELRQRMGPAFLAVRLRHSQPRYADASGPVKAPTQYAVLFTTNAAHHRRAESPAGKGDFVYFRIGDAVVSAPVGTLQDTCWMLNKALGCDGCSLRGAECLWTNLPEQVQVIRRAPLSNELLPVLRNDNMVWTGALRDSQSTYRQQLALHTNPDVDDLKSWKSTVGGFLDIPEGLTHEDPLYPGNGRRRHAFDQPGSHYFNDLEDARAKLSERSRASAKTRNFIRLQCKLCYFGSKWGPCGKYRARNCNHGSWTETGLVNYTLECARRHLHESKTSLTLNQIWAIAHVCGIPFAHKDDRTGRIAEFVVQRVGGAYSGGTGPREEHPAIFVSRTARDVRRELPALQFLSLNQLKKFLPDVIRQKLEAIPPMATAEDRRRLALWLHLSVTSHGKSYSFYFESKHSGGFSWAQPKVGTVQLHLGHVTVRLWLAKFERDHDFSTFQKVLDHHERLPYFDIGAAEDAPQGLPFQGCVR